MIVSNSYKYCGFIRASKGDGGGTDIAEYISSCTVSPSNSARTSVARFGNRKIKKIKNRAIPGKILFIVLTLGTHKISIFA
jgi:hypothetical protein